MFGISLSSQVTNLTLREQMQLDFSTFSKKECCRTSMSSLIERFFVCWPLLIVYEIDSLSGSVALIYVVFLIYAIMVLVLSSLYW